MPAIRLHDPTWLSLHRANVRMVDRYLARYFSRMPIFSATINSSN
jgi:hypothetical protein